MEEKRDSPGPSSGKSDDESLLASCCYLGTSPTVCRASTVCDCQSVCGGWDEVCMCVFVFGGGA